jgi:glycosyltransferase involved in cell wall biosynthesis
VEPLISVVIPTYNRPEFLAKAIRSTTDQTYDSVEVIVVDDCSPELMAPVVDDIDTDGLVRVKCLRHEENRGANAARNTGIRNSNGNIVAFLDDDDRWQPTLAQRYAETFTEGGPELGVVTAGVRIENESGKQIGCHIPSIGADPLGELLDGKLVGSFSRFAVRRRIIEQVGFLDEQLPSWQDWEWQLRMASVCQFASIPETLVVRTEGTHDQITDDFEQRRDVSYPRLLERHRDAIATERGRRAEHKFVALLSRTLAMSAFKTGRYASAIRYNLRAVRYYPTWMRTWWLLAITLGGPFTNHYGRRVKHWITRRHQQEPKTHAGREG